MAKPKIITDDELIPYIDKAVEDGWRILRVDTRDGRATIRFAKEVPAPWVDEPVLYQGFETVTQEWGCGLKAGSYAADLMLKA